MKTSFNRIAPYPYFNRKSLSSNQKRRCSSIPSAIDTGTVYTTMNGRSALEIGLGSLQLDSEDEVLLPAYHCPVMVYPILKAGCKPTFYKINTDCSVNLDDLDHKITKRTKAVIVIHYFGFQSAVSEIRSLCNKHNLYLIEDCAHCFYGFRNEATVGSFGDFSIVSLWKFFPTCDGGFLKFENKKLSENVRTIIPNAFFQVKSAINTLENGSGVGGRKNLRTVFLEFIGQIWKTIKTKEEKNKLPDYVEGQRINPYSLSLVSNSYSNEKTPVFSKFIYKMADKERLVRRRRNNFHILLNELKEISGVKPLFDKLPPMVVPYTFPIVSKNADKLAKNLKSRGVGVLRFGEFLWEKMDRATCPVSLYYSKQCIQIPIHQSLTFNDMEYIVKIFRKSC